MRNEPSCGASPSNDGLGAGAEAREQPQGYFSRSLLESALMTPEQETAVRKGACPKCWEKLARTSEGGGVLFRQCIGCGDIWVTEAPNVGGEARLAAHQPSQTTTATPQGVASTDQLGRASEARN